jgi:CBS-domain-containing membrane protein
VARFFGHRRPDAPPPPVGNLIEIFWALIGIFTGLMLIELITHQIPMVADHGPLVIGSFGAAAVLEFYAIDSPFAQPRNVFVGQLLSSVMGVSWCKLFQLSPDFQQMRWLGGAWSCASATAVMALTGTVHPPAASTALLAVVDNVALGLGWFLVPLTLLSCSIMFLVALLIMNIQRQFPLYWWTPDDVGRASSKMEIEKDLEADTSSGSEDDVDHKKGYARELVIMKGKVHVPAHVRLTVEEKLFLESLSNRI